MGKILQQFKQQAAWATSLLLAVSALAGCGSNPQVPKFTVQSDGKFVPGINTTANLDIMVDTTIRSGLLVQAGGEAAQEIGRSMNAGKPPVPGDFEVLNLTVRTKGVSPRSNSVGDKIMHLTFDAHELRQVVHFGGDTDAVLASASSAGWWTPANDDVVDEYCAAHEVSAFCRKFVN